MAECEENLVREMESDSESDSDEFSEPVSSPDISDSEDDEDDGADEAPIARAARGIQPYLFEPLAPEAGEGAGEAGVEAAAGGDDDAAERLGNSNWCTCSGGCTPMPTIAESVCCKEMDQVVAKVTEYNEEHAADLKCITDHPGFLAVCLNRWVLETAYFQYVQQYGGRARQDASENEKFRHTAYRQLVRWCWEFLGRHVRVPLPSCAVTKIHNTFPSQEYSGFQDV